jgi:hypothetical protein
MKRNLFLRLFVFVLVINLTASQKSIGQVFYSQNDSRWSTNTLGSCTGTHIGYVVGSTTYTTGTAAGCTITCLAMLYGGAYTPAAMNTWLMTHSGGYSSGCLLGWIAFPCGASLYTGSGTTSSYNDLYTNITAGRKAIVNVTYPGSSMSFNHWVLVYGFTGTYSTRSTASNYLVYDPWTTPSTASSTTRGNLGCFSSGFINAHYFSLSGSFSTSSAPTYVTSSCGTTSATENITWSSISGATGYEVSIKRASSSTWPTAITTTSPSYSFTGLSLSTAYNVRFRAFQCSTYGNYGTYNFSTGAHRASSSQEPAENEVTIYPNPISTNSAVSISLGETVVGQVSISIFSLDGRLISSRVYDSDNSLDLSISAPESSGMYIVKVHSSSGFTAIKKLLVL